jgi:hypothetical protein
VPGHLHECFQHFFRPNALFAQKVHQLLAQAKVPWKIKGMRSQFHNSNLAL